MLEEQYLSVIIAFFTLPILIKFLTFIFQVIMEPASALWYVLRDGKLA